MNNLRRELLVLLRSSLKEERTRRRSPALRHLSDHIGAADPVRFLKVSARPVGRLIGVGVVKAGNLQSSPACCNHNHHQLRRSDAVAVARCVRALISGADGLVHAPPAGDRMAQQHTAALVRIRLFGVCTQRVIRNPGQEQCGLRHSLWIGGVHAAPADALRSLLPMCDSGEWAGLFRSHSIFADRKATMAKKPHVPSFEQTLDILRAHSFNVAPFAGVPGGMLVSKHGAAAVLVPSRQTERPVAYAVHPGALVRGEVARLLDRGYQKFIHTSQFELPATAAQLHAIHTFSEELKQLIGDACLYNESLGTTSDLYQYDRLKGREAAKPEPARPWELASGH